MATKRETYLDALKDFPSEDSKGFEKYLQSPLLNSNKKLINLFRLRTYKNLTSTLCYEHLYPGKAPNTQVVKNLVSLLKMHYSKYLGIKTVLKNPQLLRSLALDEIQNKKKINSTWSSKYQSKVEFELLESSFNTFSFLHGHILNDFDALSYTKSSSLSFSNLLKYQAGVVDSTYYVHRCIILIHYFTYKRKKVEAIVITALENSLSDFLKDLSKRKEQIVQLYRRALLFEKNKNIKTYNSLFKSFRSLSHSTHTDHYNFIWTLLTNFCIAKANAGIESFNEQAFELYELYLLKNKTSSLKEITINNYVKLGIRVSKQKHVQQFLNDNTEFFGINACNYCSAILSYHAGNYSESLTILQKITFDTPYYKYHSKSLTVENLLNLNEIEAATYAIDSLVISMKRSKVLHNSYKQFYSYYKCLRRVIKLNQKTSLITDQEILHSKNKLIIEIQGDKALREKKVLLKHLDRLCKVTHA